MTNLLRYKDYFGTVNYSDADGVLYGEVLGINSLISYEGTSVEELRADFEGAVDEYLELCSEKGIVPEKQYKGSFNVRIDPELHRKAVIMAQSEAKSLNQFIEATIRDRIQSAMN